MRIDVSDTIGKTLVALGQATEVAGSVGVAASGWPRVLQVATPWGIAVSVNADAALNARWYPGMMPSLLGGPGHVIADPSNGKAAGQPIRSAAGFPLFYALAGGSVVGTPSVCVGDQTFNSDAEALDYLERSAAADKAAASPSNAANWASVGRSMGGQQQPSPGDVQVTIG